MEYSFYICDVFTDRRFGGNQLAVLPQAEGLSSEDMQHIAREFNFSETTFVLPAEQGHTRRVRIFTPVREIPFAGHPNVGTAFVLASTGQVEMSAPSVHVVFEEQAGLVPIDIHKRDAGRLWCELAAPQAVAAGATVPPELAAAAIGLSVDDLAPGSDPQEASVGLPFVMVEVRDRAALGKASGQVAAMQALAAQGITPDIHAYVVANDDFDLRVRMFAPLDGVPEDPATGSANCALAGLLALRAEDPDGQFSWRIAQGVEMGRPSVLEARADKTGGQVTGTWIGGASVMVARGTIEV